MAKSKAPKRKSPATTIPSGRVKTRMKKETGKLHMSTNSAIALTAGLEEYIKIIALEAKNNNKPNVSASDIAEVIRREEGTTGPLICEQANVKPCLPHTSFKRGVREFTTVTRFSRASLYNIQRITEKVITDLLVDAKMVKPKGSLTYKDIRAAAFIGKSPIMKE